MNENKTTTVTDADAHELPRLMDLKAAGEYLGGLSYWTLRSWVATGMLPVVRLPSAKTPDAKPIRRILVDRSDLDRLIERHKVCQA